MKLLSVLCYRININTAYRTSLVTLTAAYTLVIVNRSTEVYNGNRIVFADLCTLHTADTANLTLLSCLGTLVVVVTENCSLCSIKGEEVDKMSRTGIYTHLTCTALVGINSCNAFTDENCFIGTSLYAVTEADTAVYAVFGTTKKLSSHFTGLNTVVFELFINVSAVALTHYRRYHRSNASRLKTHNLSYSRRYIVSAGGTTVTLGCFALCKSSCIAVTA